MVASRGKVDPGWGVPGEDRVEAIEEAHQIRPEGVELSRDAELADQQEIIRGGILPVDHADADSGLSSNPPRTLIPGSFSQR